MTYLRPPGLTEAQVIEFNKWREGNHTRRVRGKVHESWTVFNGIEGEGTSYRGWPYVILSTEVGIFHYVGRGHLPLDDRSRGARIRFRWTKGYTWRMVDGRTLTVLSPPPSGTRPPGMTWTEHRYLLWLQRRRAAIDNGALAEAGDTRPPGEGPGAPDA
jgi:hypothetical protein